MLVSVSKLDSTDDMEDLLRIGERVAEQIEKGHFGSFL